MKKNIAVIGAGLAGLACARELGKGGHQVCIFEKSRGAGGRLSTRWTDRDLNPPVGFDHGAQYIHARSPSFSALMEAAQAAGAAKVWNGRVVHLAYGVQTEEQPARSARWVGVPGMTSLARFLAGDADLQLQKKVTEVVRQGDTHTLKIVKTDGTVESRSGFDFVVSAIPAEQTAQLFSAKIDSLADAAMQVTSEVNWTVMVSFANRTPVNFDGAFVADSPLGWICRDSSKPGRAAGERWVLQATSDWSSLHKDYPKEVVADLLMDVFMSLIGKQIEPLDLTAHRWLYGVPSNPLTDRFFVDMSASVAACGDWLCGSSAESAFSSGEALGQVLNRHFEAQLSGSSA